MGLIDPSPFKSLAIFCGCTARFLSELVGKPENRFSQNEAQLYLCHTQLNLNLFVCLFVLSCVKSEKTKSDSTYLFAI